MNIEEVDATCNPVHFVTQVSYFLIKNYRTSHFSSILYGETYTIMNWPLSECSGHVSVF